jgi:hypothetical protein
VTNPPAHIAQTVQFGAGANEACGANVGGNGANAGSSGSGGGGGGGLQGAGGAGAASAGTSVAGGVGGGRGGPVVPQVQERRPRHCQARKRWAGRAVVPFGWSRMTRSR